MQEIKAYVREYMLDHVIDALSTIPGLPGVAVVHLRGYGHIESDGGLHRVDMAKLEIDAPSELVQTVVDTIVRHARTENGHIGDGRIVVSEIKQAIRIADGRRQDEDIVDDSPAD